MRLINDNTLTDMCRCVRMNAYVLVFQTKMGSLKENMDVACYFITKHSWKGKYVEKVLLIPDCLYLCAWQ